ncbi:N-acetylmuramoyl-L-alanine amidase [Corynebacterium sp. HS2168-gen11]|uniref:N-acetylmuramoyl-L-alanine amidase n=1 Tax=Corynebacterium sp. HS2168-gen11 TaxID=2974027 RepID=UPI00216B52CB|nr:N-acetylmuramoyl-L-alanine amidase [Corynebacterium sp. HS2168-gen11]MCS4535961.1 N-acetylmuramoyl-L-alanine amidase [Corynebacterium sp. HS2168-gen11]
MKQRRSLNKAPTRPLIATGLAITLTAGMLVGVNNQNILFTEGEGPAPIDTPLATTTLDTGDNVVIDDPELRGQGDDEASRTVKQFNRAEEFNMFALTWRGEKDIAAFVRSQRADGSWSEWFDVEPLDYAVEGPNTVQGTDLVFVEPTRAVQVNLTGVDLFNAEEARTLDAVFVDGGNAGTVDTEIELANDAVGLPKIISRKGWGADESLRCGTPEFFTGGVKGISIHHTAGSNNYTPAQAPGIMRGIFKYHARTLGWCDIGYHALADKYGNLYEGRFGGLNKDVIGAHAGGFNNNTWAISMIGDYNKVDPSPEMIKSVGELAGWRAKVAGIDPLGSNTHVSGGTRFTQYRQGTSVRLPNIFGHRDVGLTECPGDLGYAKLGAIRTVAKAKYTSIQLGNAVDTGKQMIDIAPNGDTPKQSAPLKPEAASPVKPQATISDTTQNPISDIVTLLSAISGNKNSKDPAVIATAAVSLIVLGIGVATAMGVTPDSVAKLGNVKVAKNLKLEQIPPILDAAASMSSDSKLSRLWHQLSPVLGKLRSGQVKYTNANGREITYQLAENGILLETPETGAHALWGAIGDAWAGQGFDLGPLGLPLNEEYRDGDKIRVDFEGGFITFDPATGALDIQAANPDAIPGLEEIPAVEWDGVVGH